MGFVFYVISVVLRILILPFGVAYGFYVCFYDRHIGDALVSTDAKFRKMALADDVYGNVYAAELFNAVLITKDAVYRFGHYGETISAVLGHNQLQGTLTPVGKYVVRILDRIEKDHCIKAVALEKIIH